MSTHKQTWKNLEKKIRNVFAKYGDAQRISRGKMGEASNDVEWKGYFRQDRINLSIETKLRGHAPAILNQMLNQAKGNAKDGEIPIACFKGKYATIDNVIVAIRLKDFEQLLMENQKDH